MVRSTKENLAFFKVKSRYNSLLEEYYLIFSASEVFVLFEVCDSFDMVVVTSHDKHSAFLDLFTGMCLSS